MSKQGQGQGQSQNQCQSQSQSQGQVELQLAYYITEEILDAEQIEKILWNDRINEMLERYGKYITDVNILGLYGTMETVIKFLEEITSCRIKVNDEINRYDQRGMLCMCFNNSNIYICFICSDEYFTKQLFQESAEITLYRYLKDLCQNIVLLPSEKIIENWKSIKNHFYQEQDSIVMEFEISQIDETKLETQKLQLQMPKVSFKFNPELLKNQEQVRCTSEQQLYNDDTKIKDEVIKNWFLCIVKHKDYNLSEINFEKYGPRVSKVLICNFQQSQKQINNFFFEKFEEYKKLMKKEKWYSSKTELQSILTIFNLSTNICFNIIRSALLLGNVGYIHKEQIIDKFKNELNYQNIDFKASYIKDLNDLIGQTIEYFKNISKDINMFYKNLFQKISNDFFSIVTYQNQEIILQTQIIKFYAINTIDKSEQITKFEIFQFQVNVNNISAIEFPKFTSIYYFFQIKNQNYFILNYEEPLRRQYLWVQNDVSDIKIILKLNEQAKLQFHYDCINSTLYVFNTRLGVSVIQYNEDRRIIKSEKVVHLKGDNNFIDLAYLQYFECFILLNQKHEVFKWNIDSQNIQKIDSKRHIKYERVLSTGSGNYYSLIGQNIIYIFNFNNEGIFEIDFERCFDQNNIQINQIHLFSDQQDWYFTLIQENFAGTFRIKNLSNQQKIVAKQQMKQTTRTSNPFLDLLKGSVIKYGPCSNILPTIDDKTQLYIHEIYKNIQLNKLPKEQTYFKYFVDYFDGLDLDSTDKLTAYSDSIRDISTYRVRFTDLLFVLISRQAVQLCTIEKSLLIPLSSGLKQQDQYEQEVRILDKVNRLKFGVIEKLLNLHNQYEQNIFIVSIMGRQSSGKSYLLNRIFGTRFGVSSARCTDGIWMSVSKIDDHLFVLLDCEGLFSTRRTSEEETMLLAFLSSISDITILNQDLTFSRNLNELFQNLSKTIQQIRGDKLFKGKLMIAVRDVNQREQDPALQELLRNIKQIKNNQHTGNFLKSLFNDNFFTILMSYFDNKQFDKEIVQIRNGFLQNSNLIKRWDNSEQLMRSMKIMLVQIEVKDHRSLEDHEVEYIIRNQQVKANELWDSMIQQEIPELRLSEQKQSYNILLQYSENQIMAKKSTIQHNENLQKQDKIIQDILMKRSFKVVNEIRKELQQSSISKEKFDGIVNDIQQQLDINIQKYQICFEKCSECFLCCRLAKNHLQRDQIQLKEDLQKQVMILQLQIKDISNSIQIKIDVGLEWQNIEKLEKDQQLIQKQINLKQDIIKRDHLVSGLKALIGKHDYNDNLFACYMNEFLQLAFNLQSADENLQNNILEIKGQIQNSVTDLEQDISNKKERLNQLDVQIGQINLEELFNCSNNYEQNQVQLNLEIKQDQHRLQQYISSYNQQTDIVENYYQKHQMIFEKYIGQDVTKLDKTYATQNDILELKMKQIDDQIHEAVQKLQLETNKDGIFHYVKNSIENNDSQLNELEFDINDLKNDYDGNMKKREQFLDSQKPESQNFQKYLNKFEQKSQDLITSIQQKQEHFQSLTQQQQQLMFLNEKFNQLNDQDLQKLSNSRTYILRKYARLNITSSSKSIKVLKLKKEIQTLLNSNWNKLNIQIIQNMKRINYNPRLKQQRIQELSLKLNRLKETIILQEGDLNKLEEEKILLQNIIQGKQTDLKLSQDKLKLHLENECLLEKINQSREDINQINNQIQSQIQILCLNDSQFFDQTTLESLQAKCRSISIEIAQIHEQRLKYNQLDQLQKQYDQCSNELKDIENYINKQHNCGRQQHSCDQYCSGCIQEQNPCKYQAGHISKFHLCTKENHFCKQKCNVKNCGKNCQQQFNHDVSIQHNCLENHVCEGQCAYCPKICKLSNDHQIHQCEQVQCASLCYFNSHSFSDETKCMNQCSYLHKDKHQNHICSNQAHQCFQKCELLGTCQIATYTEILKTWETQNGQFQYKMYKQNAERLQCQEKLTQQQVSHDNKHHCNKDHICDQRCPECDAFCTLKIGHQGKHQPHLHRNKDQQVFTFLQDSNTNQLEIQELGLQNRVYQAGDSCEPETCTASCARRSRAHFHLVECKGNQECAELKLNQIAKKVANHQGKKYQGSDKFYDEVLCETYWNMLGWEHPVENKQRNEINLCNFYCNACFDKEKYFCTKEAWHTSSTEYRDHNFSCSDKHKIQGVDVAFVFDSTGSMSPYIKVVLDTIKMLMTTAQQYFQKQGKQQEELQFSIVSYKDHDHPIVVEHIDFCKSSDALDFLSKIKIVGGKDVPEAMFDGLHKATTLKWRPDTKKFLILLCDSPPHGTPKYQQKYQDLYPQGCPCGYNEENTLPKIMGMNIQMITYKLHEILNQTMASFKKIMPQLIVYEDLSTVDFIKKIENLVCQQLEIREITMSKQ